MTVGFIKILFYCLSYSEYIISLNNDWYDFIDLIKKLN